MRTQRMIGRAIAVVMVLGMPLGVAHAQSQHVKAGGAATKLGRSLVNIVSGWVEIPKRMYETSQDQGTAAGLTWGLVRGVTYGFVRTAAGLYELLTFPFPAPPDYASVIQPEYVFVDERSVPPSSTEYKSTDYKYR